MVPPHEGGARPIRARTDATYLRQVVFLTDGAIGNEQQLFDTIGAMRGRSRVFMVGIGSAPNSFLMTRAAEIGRGTFTHIGSVEQVEERMRALFEKLESPVVTNLTATFAGRAGRTSTPALLPDLYRGEPVVLAAKLAIARPADLRSRAASATARGSSRCRSRTPRRATASRSCGRGARSPTPRSPARCASSSRRRPTRVILALALDHHLVTRLTSLVAVDKTPSRPDGARLTRADLPLNLPAGWDFDKVFGERPAATPPSVRRRGAPSAPSAPQLAQLDAAAFRAVAQSTLPRPAAHPPPKGVAAADDRDRCGAAHVARRCCSRWPDAHA